MKQTFRPLALTITLGFFLLPVVQTPAETKTTAARSDSASTKVHWLPNTSGDASPVKADVCVYGGTSAGVMAAIQAARDGKRCVLVSPDRRLGGLTVNGLGWTDIGNPLAVGGLAKEFYHRVYLHYQDPRAWLCEASSAYFKRCSLRDDARQTMFTFEPSVAAEIMEDMLAESQAQVIQGRIRRPGGVVKENGKIVQLRTEEGACVQAKVFIDASYEGDLLAVAGVSYVIGREANQQYGETLNGIQVGNAKFHQFPPGIDPYVVPGKPESGLLPHIEPRSETKDGEADARLQAYCYRMCLTDVASNRLDISKPEDYRTGDFELIFRALAAGKKDSFFTTNLMPNRKTDCNNNGGISLDFIGANYDLGQGWNYAEADYKRRQQILVAHRDYQLGFIWTLQNDPRVPEKVRQAYSAWGLPKDEFIDNNHWPEQIYVREARRMLGDFVITQHDVNKEPDHIAKDPVGMGGYAMDSHNVRRYVTARGGVLNEGDVQVSPARGPYGISYRAMVPKVGQAPNLLVPVCLSASHIAYGSIRMEPVFMILGQSAALAAGLAVDEDIPVQQVSYRKLEPRLLKVGQVLKLSPEAARVAMNKRHK